MSERFNYFSDNSEPPDEAVIHLNGNGSGASANGNGGSNGATTNGNGNRPYPLSGRYPTLNGRKDNAHSAPNSNQNEGDPPPPSRPSQPPTPADSTQGHSVLSGALAAFSPSSLLSLLSIQKQTGWLYMRNTSLRGYIYVDKGEVYDAGIGPVSSGALAVFQLFGWKQGEFNFETGRPAPERRTIEVSLPVLQVRATLWLDNMNKYSQYIPSPSHQVTIAAEPRSEVVIEPYQWAVLTKIVARSLSVAELALELNQDLMTVTRIATELVKMGVAVVRPPQER